MTAVIIRRIESRLTRMIGRSQGVKAREAVRAAEQNLVSIMDICADELKTRLSDIAAFGRAHPRARPSDAELKRLINLSERALTACGALNQPRIARVLLTLAAMADALTHTDFWPEGALTPAIDTLGLIQVGALPDQVADDLIGELERCLTRYVLHADDMLAEQDGVA